MALSQNAIELLSVDRGVCVPGSAVLRFRFDRNLTKEPPYSLKKSPRYQDFMPNTDKKTGKPETELSVVYECDEVCADLDAVAKHINANRTVKYLRRVSIDKITAKPLPIGIIVDHVDFDNHAKIFPIPLADEERIALAKALAQDAETIPVENNLTT